MSDLFFHATNIGPLVDRVIRLRDQPNTLAHLRELRVGGESNHRVKSLAGVLGNRQYMVQLGQAINNPVFIWLTIKPTCSLVQSKNLIMLKTPAIHDAT